MWKTARQRHSPRAHLTALAAPLRTCRTPRCRRNAGGCTTRTALVPHPTPPAGPCCATDPLPPEGGQVHSEHGLLRTHTRLGRTKATCAHPCSPPVALPCHHAGNPPTGACCSPPCPEGGQETFACQHALPRFFPPAPKCPNMQPTRCAATMQVPHLLAPAAPRPASTRWAGALRTRPAETSRTRPRSRPLDNVNACHPPCNRIVNTLQPCAAAAAAAPQHSAPPRRHATPQITHLPPGLRPGLHPEGGQVHSEDSLLRLHTRKGPASAVLQPTRCLATMQITHLLALAAPSPASRRWAGALRRRRRRRRRRAPASRR